MKWLNSTKKVTCYLASAWFQAEQEETRQICLKQLEKHGISYFSPKDESLCPPDATGDTQSLIFKGNVQAIDNADFVLVNTAGKDMGSIFEAGHAYARSKPIIYLWIPPANIEKPQLNLMLAQSGVAACMSEEELDKVLTFYVNNSFDFSSKFEYTGEVE